LFERAPAVTGAFAHSRQSWVPGSPPRSDIIDK
jgi:hypothetical protein